MDLLRFSTAGSVDDGKSTLIGRLLYDSKAILQDQYEALRRSSLTRNRGGDVDLALLTDGLRAEREQGITIDVAYRYFATPKRKFIIADTPGHEQYTRNMVTGASTAELAIVLIDVRNGVLTQSRRHGFISALLQIPHILVAINKMDLVDYAESAFDAVVEEYGDFARRVEIGDITFIPISALKGDNVVHKSANMAWYDGPTLLHHLETVKVGADENVVDFRFPVQTVVRPNQNFRGYAGQVASGTIGSGDEIVTLPSRRSARVKEVLAFERRLDKARPGDAVVLTLDEEIDVSRGDMLVRARNIPSTTQHLDADLCWMDTAPLQVGKEYVLQHTTRRVQARVSKIIYRMNVDTLEREPASAFSLNEIGRVEVTTSQPVFIDPYRLNRRTGCFILIDPASNQTAGAAMIRGVAQDVPPVGVRRQTYSRSTHVVWEGLSIKREAREARNGHAAAVVWLTGLSGSGKSAIGRTLEQRLFDSGCHTMLLDGDYLRHGLNADLGFSPDDRTENIRRAGEVARLFFEHGAVVVCTFVSPFTADRNFVRSLIPKGRFFEVFVDCDLEVCKQRDPKGLYAKALRGEIPEFTGISSPYEPPEYAESVIRSDRTSTDEAVVSLLRLLREHNIVP